MRFDKRNLGDYSIPLSPPTRKKKNKTKKNNKIIIKEEKIKPGFIKCPICGEIQSKKNLKCKVCKVNLNNSERVINFIKEKSSPHSTFFLLFNNKNSLNQLVSAFKDNNIYENVKILDNADKSNLSNDLIVENFHDELTKLININKYLNFHYNIPFFNNIYSAKYLKNLSVLRENYKYIDDADLNEFLMFIKAYFYNISNNGINFDESYDLVEYIDKFPAIKDEIFEFNDNVNKLYNFYNQFGIHIQNDLNSNIKLIDQVKILRDNPSLIDDESEVSTFLEILNKYNNLNKKNKDSSYFIKNFKIKNKILSKVINYYDNFLRKDTQIILESKIIKFDLYLNDFGFNLINIYEINDFKDLVLYYKNAELIQDEDYYILNNKLEDYFKNSNISFSEFFKKYHKKLMKLVKDKITEKSVKSYEKSEIDNVKILINDLFNQFELSNDINNFFELEENMIKLNNIFSELENILDNNNLEYLKSKDFNSILQETPKSYMFKEYNELYKIVMEKVKNCNINNFNEIISDLKNELPFKKNDKKLNEIILNFSLIKEIIDLSSKFYDINLFDYTFDELLDFHKKIQKNIEFTDYFNNGLFNENIFDFYNSKTMLNDLDEIEIKLKKLNNYIDKNSIFIANILNKSTNQAYSFSEFENIFIPTKQLFNKESNTISDYKLIIDNLIKLVEEYDIGDKNETVLFINPLLKSKEKINKYSLMYDYEKKLDNFKEIIENNLNGIWRGYSTKLNKIENKLSLDLQFTKLYHEKIFTEETLTSCCNFSKSDLKFLEKIKRKLYANYETICDNKNYNFNSIYNNEELLQIIEHLGNLDNNNDSFKILLKINEILDRNDLNKLINDSWKINYQNLINKYNLIDESNILFLLNNYVKYTQLIDYNIINENNIDIINENLDDIIFYINQFEEYRLIIMERIMKIDQFDLFTDYNEMLNQISEKRIFLLNKKLLNKPITKEFVDYFDKIIIPLNCDEMYIKEILNATDKLLKIL